MKRFKKQGFRSPFNAAHVLKILENELTVLKKSLDDSLIHAVEPPLQIRQALFQFVKKNIDEWPYTKRAYAIVDLRQYFNLKHSGENVDPL